jgi:hypothetical protein
MSLIPFAPLKLARFPPLTYVLPPISTSRFAHLCRSRPAAPFSPLPIAALPSIALCTKALFPRSRRILCLQSAADTAASTVVDLSLARSRSTRQQTLAAAPATSPFPTAPFMHHKRLMIRERHDAFQLVADLYIVSGLRCRKKICYFSLSNRGVFGSRAARVCPDEVLRGSTGRESSNIYRVGVPVSHGARSDNCRFHCLIRLPAKQLCLSTVSVGSIEQEAPRA